MTVSSLGSLLIVDDEVELMNALRELLNESGYRCVGTSHPREAIQILQAERFDLLLSDLMMPEIDGIQLLVRALEIDPNLVPILMTGQGTIQTAVEAMKRGAFDYVLKPFKLQTILPVLNRAMEIRRLKTENQKLHQYVEKLTFESKRYEIIGSSPAIRKVLNLIEKVAPSDATVLVRGPSGAGKELVARALHKNSNRCKEPLVTINCATLQETLLESELFGHEKGAFTGATQAKPGLFEIAEGGTLFIDEIAEMSPFMQAKLLRVLENGHYRRVGSTHESYANVRVIAATNKSLEAEQKAGRFREDLFYRLNVITIDIPALKDRKDDIPALVEHFLATRPATREQCQIEESAMTALVNYAWPGNIRELVNVIERAQILATGNRITLDDLPEEISHQRPVVSVPEIITGSTNLERLEDIEAAHVGFILKKYRGNKVQAAQALAISRRTLYRFIDRYHLDGSKDSSN